MTLQELIEYHQKQAVHFEPFGASNALTVFHLAAVETLKEAASSVVSERERIEPMFSQSDIEAAVLAEREACAEICDSLKPYGVDKHAVEYAAEQIRARSND